MVDFSARRDGICPVILIDDFCLFFNDTATTEIYTLSLHDALPICAVGELLAHVQRHDLAVGRHRQRDTQEIGRGTRLNSSHITISYAVFCLKKKKKKINEHKKKKKKNKKKKKKKIKKQK